MPLLSNAQKLFVGETSINKVFANGFVVWPKSVYKPTPSALHYFTCDNTYSSLPPYSVGDLSPVSSNDIYPPFSEDGRINQCLLNTYREADNRSINTIEIDKLSMSTTEFKSIAFIEAYVKIGMVYEEPTTNNGERFQLSLRQEDFNKYNSSGLYLAPFPDGTMQASLLLQSANQSKPGGWTEDYFIPYTKPSWVHVSISLETYQINTSAKTARLRSYFSVNGKVIVGDFTLKDVISEMPLKSAALKAVARLPGSTLNRPDTVLFDEIRTATEPLYRSDFQPE